MLTYQTEIKVFLEGKRVGTIRRDKKFLWRYFPKGHKEGGEGF